MINALGGGDTDRRIQVGRSRIALQIFGSGFGGNTVIGMLGNHSVNGFALRQNEHRLFSPPATISSSASWRLQYDKVEGQAGHLTRSASTAPLSSRTSTIQANGGRLQFFRDIAAVTMDLDDVERIEFQALGGSGHYRRSPISRAPTPR